MSAAWTVPRPAQMLRRKASAVSLFKRLRTLGGDVKIAGLTGQPKEIFRLLRLDRVFDVFDSVEAAAAKFG